MGGAGSSWQGNTLGPRKTIERKENRNVRVWLVAENFFHRGLCLPSGSNLVKGDLERVEAVVRRVAVG